MQSDLAKQFSLDHLISGSQQAPAPSFGRTTKETAAPAGLAPAEFAKMLDLLSTPVLRALETQPNREMRLFELSDKLAPVYGEIPMPMLGEIVDFLDTNKRLRIVERQRHGNHLVKLV